MLFNYYQFTLKNQFEISKQQLHYTSSLIARFIRLHQVAIFNARNIHMEIDCHRTYMEHVISKPFFIRFLGRVDKLANMLVKEIAMPHHQKLISIPGPKFSSPTSISRSCELNLAPYMIHYHKFSAFQLDINPNIL